MSPLYKELVRYILFLPKCWYQILFVGHLDNIRQISYMRSNTPTLRDTASHWAIPDKLCPPAKEDVSATYAINLEFHLPFYKFFLEIQSEETKKSGFWVPVCNFCGNLCENKDFCPRNLEIQEYILAYVLPKKVWKSNLLYWGRAKYFLNSSF